MGEYQIQPLADNYRSQLPKIVANRLGRLESLAEKGDHPNFTLFLLGAPDMGIPSFETDLAGVPPSLPELTEDRLSGEAREAITKYVSALTYGVASSGLPGVQKELETMSQSHEVSDSSPNADELAEQRGYVTLLETLARNNAP